MKFTTTLEAVSSNKTKTTIKLSLSNAEARKFTAQYLNSIDKELIVTFDDPQMEMELRPAPNGRGGIVATVDSQGVVQSAERSEEPEDDHSDLFEQTDGEDAGERPEEEVRFEEPVDGGESEDGYEEQIATDESGNDAEGGDEAADAPEDSGQEEEPAGEVDKGQLEAYILNEQPSWSDIPYNFPEMLRRRSEEGMTWIKLAKELGIPSSTLQAFWGVYKKRVKKQILASKGAA